MKIILVGASGTMGSYLTNAFGREHDIIRAGRKGADIQVDITNPASIESMYQQVGPFDALVSTAGPTYVGPWKNLNNETFRTGIEGKMMGQINLVLIGQHFINTPGSFTLITGVLTYEPQKHFANASAANAAVEGFVRAAAIELAPGLRINAVSPSVLESSPQYFPYFPGEVPTTMQALEYAFRKSLFGAHTGQVIKP
ncbi:short chain dehydrogenase [Paraflavitalea pollutisoli]|uniref:short chain dehydrogenase n=1 Tax=Paraflavitalea pollutisoli TaxID=3034143 RepID=UPI0023EC4BF2|nr:short chain dehydrogenase [Paraflavitalea sp. H1-2-19X]